MQNYLSIEESEKSHPVLLLYGYTKDIREELVRLNSKKFRIIIVGSKKPNFLQDYEEVYFISYKKADLLTKLQEKIDYALVFLSDEVGVKNLGYLTVKAAKDKTKVLAVARSETIAEDLKRLEKTSGITNIRYCVLGEVLSSKKKGESELSKIIENAIINQEIRLDGREESSVFCISLGDATTAIQRLLFGNFRREIIYYLFYKNPETILEAVYTIARVEPETKIIFSENPQKNKLKSRDEFNNEVYEISKMDFSYIDSLIGFEKSVENFFQEKDSFIFSKKERKKRRKKQSRGPVRKALKYTIISLVAGFLLFIFLNFLFFGFGLLFLRQSVSNVEQGEFSKAANNAKRANFLLEIVKPSIELSFDVIATIDTQGQTQQTYRLIRKAGELSEIGGSTISGILESTAISESEILTSLANFSFIFQEGQRIQNKTQNQSLAHELKTNYSNLLSLSQVLPEVLGFNSDMNYLLLFQNNEELRPTGGFIGSVGDLTVSKGVIKELIIQDVYDLDGQLKHHVEPPFVVRRYLQPHLYLRDSNFPLDFQEAASSSAFLYNLESGRQPKAVIAIDLDVLKKILKITGPLNLPSYNVVVDEKNVSQFLQSTIEDNFFPGSTQKKDVLNSVFNQIVEKTKNDKKFNIALIKLLPELLEKKNIQVSFSDTSIQKVFSANGYGGSYNDTRPLLENKINDYLFINEANIGVNKVNSQVSRTITYRSIIGQDSQTSVATLNLTNASKVDDYKTYLTFVVPKDSVIKSIKIDGVERAFTTAVTDPLVYEQVGFAEPVELEVEQFVKNNLTHISFVITAPKNKKTIISLDYQNGATKKLLNTTDYSLFVVTQPGIGKTNFKVIYDYPEGYIPVGINATNYGSNFFEKDLVLEDDLLLEFKLQKKN